MTRLQFATAMRDQGHTVLFRDPDTMRYITVRPQDWDRNVRLIGGVIYVNGKDASGWTVCKKP
jgi:endonuclease YncB( thermonuclease family)